MPEAAVKLKQVLPRKGLVFNEDKPNFAFCKPKLMPLKSITLEKMDKMKEEAEKKMKNTDLKDGECCQQEDSG
ncbi:Uncharacterised protein g2870 [Pycnogonum litorale]